MDNQLEKRIKDENRKLHNFSADSYDNWPPHVTNENDLMFFHDTKLMNELLGKGAPLALECGCGTGKLTKNLVKNGFDIDAVDISYKMVDIARKKISDHSLQKSTVSFHVSDIDGFLAKSDKNYDLICFSAVLHHIGDYLKTLRMATNLVTPGGFIYIGGEPQLQGSKKWIHKSIDFLCDTSIIGYKFIRNPRSSIRFIKNVLLGKKQDSKINVALAEFHAANGIDDKQIIKLLEDEGFKIICYEKFLRFPFAFFEVTNRFYDDGPKLFKVLAQKQ